MMRSFRQEIGRVLLFSIAILLCSGSGLGQSGRVEESGDFESLASRAEMLREAGHLRDAARAYEEALQLRPDWEQGLWHRGTILYDLGDFQKARSSFQKLASRRPEAGPVWAFLGLSEYRVRDYVSALKSLQRARRLGVGGNKELNFVLFYHIAILLNRFENYEKAHTLLEDLSLEYPDHPSLVEAFGLSVLRLPFLPEEVPADRAEAVKIAGRAALYARTHRFEEARRQLELLAEKFPEMPNVHYGRAVFFLNHGEPDRALQEFHREVELSPDHVPALLQISFEYLRRGDAESALEFASRAVRLSPDFFAARNALGRSYLNLGEVEKAVAELERGVELAPESPEMRYALVRAYNRAGRREDARQQQEAFERLKREQAEREAEAPLAPKSDSTRSNPSGS